MLAVPIQSYQNPVNTRGILDVIFECFLYNNEAHCSFGGTDVPCVMWTGLLVGIHLHTVSGVNSSSKLELLQVFVG